MKEQEKVLQSQQDQLTTLQSRESSPVRVILYYMRGTLVFHILFFPIKPLIFPNFIAYFCMLFHTIYQSQEKSFTVKAHS